MKPIVTIVKVMCKCGWWITIRAVGGGVKAGKFCWQCGRQVWFISRGWMKADGKYRNSDGTEGDTEAKVIYQENQK